MNEQPITNSNAITSLTMGILSLIIPSIGSILGIFGIVGARKATREIEKT